MSKGKPSSLTAYRITFTHDGHAHLEEVDGPAKRDSFYYVRDETITDTFWSTLPEELADLIDVALAVYVADRLARRHSQAADRHQRNWSRHFHLRLPLRDPERWHDQALNAQLRAVLAFLTDDKWCFDFFPRSGSRRISEMRRYLYPTLPASPVTAALFSGGVDSLAGLCRELVEHPTNSTILFCGGTNRRTIGVQRELAEAARLRLNRDITPVILPFGLYRRAGRQHDSDERTQRSRGFVFQVLGAVTTIMANVDNLAVYEHGIGAINLPYTAAQLGAHSTRATHPLTLAAMGELITLATSRQFTFRLPFLFVTKGELCTILGKLGFGDLVAQTISCDGFPQRVPGRPQCGLCTSCLLRRQALHAAGLSRYDKQEGYVHDVLDPAARLSPAKLYPLRAMLDQVNTLRGVIDQPEPWRVLSRVYPQLVEVAACVAASDEPLAAVKAQLIALYRRYCAEWENFPVKPWARTAGHAA